MKWSEMKEEERNALVAEKVMGWKEVESALHLEANCFFNHKPREVILVLKSGCVVSMDEFSPSTNIEHAMKVVEKMSKDGWEFNCGNNWKHNVEWMVHFISLSNGEPKIAGANSLPEAICLAALGASGIEIE